MSSSTTMALVPTLSPLFPTLAVQRTSLRCGGTDNSWSFKCSGINTKSSLKCRGIGDNRLTRTCSNGRSNCRCPPCKFSVPNCLSSAPASNASEYNPMVKMCGISSAEDAAFVAQAGASFVGLIMWPGSKRYVSVSAAKEICASAREFGAEPVGVFVSESVQEIEKACESTGLSWAQLHGDGARASVIQLSRSGLKTIFVMQSDTFGCLQTSISSEQESAVDLILVDGLEGGGGVAFNWDNFQVPSLCKTKGWLLAGGLNPKNVANALSTLRPHAVDVASGIAGPDGIKKDPRKILAFMQAVRASTCAAA